MLTKKMFIDKIAKQPLIQVIPRCSECGHVEETQKLPIVQFGIAEHGICSECHRDHSMEMFRSFEEPNLNDLFRSRLSTLDGRAIVQAKTTFFDAFQSSQELIDEILNTIAKSQPTSIHSHVPGESVCLSRTRGNTIIAGEVQSIWSWKLRPVYEIARDDLCFFKRELKVEQIR